MALPRPAGRRPGAVGPDRQRLAADACVGRVAVALPGAGGGRSATPTQVGHGWNTFDRIIGARDVDRYGWVDLVARQPSGSMYLYPGNGAGRFRTPTKIGTGWAEFDLLI